MDDATRERVRSRMGGPTRIHGGRPRADPGLPGTAARQTSLRPVSQSLRTRPERARNERPAAAVGGPGSDRRCRWRTGCTGGPQERRFVEPDRAHPWSGDRRRAERAPGIARGRRRIRTSRAKSLADLDTAEVSSALVLSRGLSGGENSSNLILEIVKLWTCRAQRRPAGREGKVN